MQFAEALKDAGMAVLDLTKAALGHYRSSGPPLYYKHDHHFNPAGHELAASEIFKFLVSGSDM